MHPIRKFANNRGYYYYYYYYHNRVRFSVALYCLSTIKEGSMVTCEQCAKDHPHEISHSMWAVLQKVTKKEYSFYQCEQGQTFRYVNYQHFHCSHAHMIDGMKACIQAHYTEEALHAPGNTILHKIVLGSGLACTVCQTPLIDQAYRFCLTQGLPFHRVPDQSTEDLQQWCCSLEHARQNTIQLLEGLEVCQQP